MERRHSLPAPLLRPYIERYWSVRASPGEEVRFLPVLPGTGAEYFVHFGRAFVTAAGARLPPEHLFALRNRGLALCPARDFDVFAVRFRAGALRHFSPSRASRVAELIDVPIGTRAAFGERGQRMVDALRSARTFRERVAAADVHLADMVARHRAPDPLVDAVVRRVYYGAESVTVAELADAAGVSRRQLERRVSAALGVGPKSFVRLARLQRTVRRVVLAQTTDYAVTAIDAGYYDQAHFIHELKEYANVTPRDFFCAAQRVSHFYNPSLTP